MSASNKKPFQFAEPGPSLRIFLKMLHTSSEGASLVSLGQFA